jgi:ribosome-interacting GTPase 1
MPTNVTPEYKKAEAEFRKARDPEERLRWLQEMLKLIPKHKGTEHLQADIKSRIKELRDELTGPRKGAARTGPTHYLRPEGAAQISLLGPPNSGKSSLHRRLTGSQAEVGPYPHTTQAPLPGMFPHEDVQFQLIDLPPVSVDYMEPWLPNAVQPAHAALLVVDLALPGVVENVVAIRERLDEKRITLVDDWGGRLAPGLAAVDGLAEPLAAASPPGAADAGEDGEPLALDDPFRRFVPTILVVGKSDLGVDPEEVAVLLELAEMAYPAVRVSAETGEGLGDLGRMLFRGLDLVRVYTKVPGKPADYDRPYTLFRGETVLDVARQIHRDIAASLRFAKVWGSAKFDGQQVGKEYVVADGDVLELHA